jgi:hypothetical protein
MSQEKLQFDFVSAVHQLAEKAVLKIIGDGGWISPDYSNRVKLPADFMAGVWSLVDTKKLQQAMAERLEAELAERMVNHMAAELATDIKQILSVTERREALRSLARQHMESIMAAGRQEG